MKKRVFIAIHYMEIGGAESSLIGLLQSLDYNRVDVELFIHSHQGELMQYIPSRVNILPEIPDYSQIERPLINVFRDGFWKIGMARLKSKFQFKLYCWRKKVNESAAVLQYVADTVTPLLPSLYSLGEYDLAISFLNPHNIVRDKVIAKKKIAWIHTDYSKVDVNNDIELPVWKSYDHIISISPDVTNSFIRRFPSLEPKIVMMENIISTEFIREKSVEFDVSEDMPRKGIRLLSVGRFAFAKNYDNVPDICKRIVENGFPDLKWYIVGYGGQETLIRQMIKSSGMQDHVVILGKKSNPYPYIRECDFYVQPSRYEGKSITVREAQILCKPVIITNYPTAASQITDCKDGIIVPLDNVGCAQGIIRFIQDKDKQEDIINYLRENDYGNKDAVNVLYTLL